MILTIPNLHVAWHNGSAQTCGPVVENLKSQQRMEDRQKAIPYAPGELTVMIRVFDVSIKTPSMCESSKFPKS